MKYRCPARHEGWACPSDEQVQRGQPLRQDGARPVRLGPAAVPADPAGDEGVRAALQGADGGRAGQRAAQGLLGRRRRQRDRGRHASTPTWVPSCWCISRWPTGWRCRSGTRARVSRRRGCRRSPGSWPRPTRPSERRRERDRSESRRPERRRGAAHQPGLLCPSCAGSTSCRPDSPFSPSKTRSSTRCRAFLLVILCFVVAGCDGLQRNRLNGRGQRQGAAVATGIRS